MPAMLGISRRARRRIGSLRSTISQMAVTEDLSAFALLVSCGSKSDESRRSAGRRLVGWVALERFSQRIVQRRLTVNEGRW